MIDATDPAIGLQLLEALRSRTIAVPDAAWDNSELRVSALGFGESYAAWLATDGAISVVFRLPRRAAADMPTPMTDEMAAAAFIPDDVGSRAILMDAFTDNLLGSPYIASTFAAGSVKPVNEWDQHLLQKHAAQLARLHNPRFQAAGSVGEEGAPVDIIREFEEGYKWWQNTEPTLADADDVAALAMSIRSRLNTLAPAFEGISYSFIHGDLVVPNVVVDDAGTPRFIDWEWARIGDIAQDLAAIGGRVHGGPWYMPMSEAAVHAFLVSYRDARGLQGKPLLEPLERLRMRREAWELTERFLSSLHFAKQARDRADPSFYPDAVTDLRRTLSVYLATRESNNETRLPNGS